MRIGLGHEMLDAELAAGRCKCFRAIAAAVVGHHAVDGDAQARKIGDHLRRAVTALSFFSSGKIAALARVRKGIPRRRGDVSSGWA
jgi:hypothetical protein